MSFTFSIFDLFYKFCPKINLEFWHCLINLPVFFVVETWSQWCSLFHLISWCGNFVEKHSFRIVSGTRDYVETVLLCKISAPGNSVKLRYFWNLEHYCILCRQRWFDQTTKQPLKNFEPQKPCKYKQFWGLRTNPSSLEKKISVRKIKAGLLHEYVMSLNKFVCKVRASRNGMQ